VPDALSELAKLQGRGVRFQSLSQDVDLTTPEGKLQFTLTAAMAARNARRSAYAPDTASPPRG
jgi:DNA invertase Pin-like site-specific DNA recombinase